MKKIIPLLILLLLFSSIPVYAAETVSFSLNSVECKNNRLIDIEVSAQCDKKLSAAIFEFTYDPSVLEFREAKPGDGAQVVTHQTEQRVRLSYLHSSGAEITDATVIFTLEFKTIAEGSSDIQFTVSDCVDADVQPMNVGTCTAGSITVTPKADDRVGRADTAPRGSSATAAPRSRQHTSRASSEKASAAHTKAAKETDTSSVSDLGTLDSVVQKDADRLTPIIVLCCSGAVTAALIGYIIFQIRGKQTKNSSD